jgi:hypothetical protein
LRMEECGRAHDGDIYAERRKGVGRLDMRVQEAVATGAPVRIYEGKSNEAIFVKMSRLRRILSAGGPLRLFEVSQKQRGTLGGADRSPDKPTRDVGSRRGEVAGTL